MELIAGTMYITAYMLFFAIVIMAAISSYTMLKAKYSQNKPESTGEKKDSPDNTEKKDSPDNAEQADK